MSKDYYKILGVSKDASKDEIRRAYRELAHQHHPDKKGGDEKKFKEINEAYQVLSDDNKRQQYDQFGTTFEGFQGAPRWDFSGQGVNFEDLFSFFGRDSEEPRRFYRRSINLEDLFSDMFGEFFGGASFSQRKSRGRNIVVDMEINLKDALKGIEKEIRLEDSNVKLRVKLKVPKGLSKEEEELIEKLKKEEQ